jgi:hypothetical protein
MTQEEKDHNEQLLAQMKIDTKINMILAIVSALSLLVVWYDVSQSNINKTK